MGDGALPGAAGDLEGGGPAFVTVPMAVAIALDNGIWGRVVTVAETIAAMYSENLLLWSQYGWDPWSVPGSKPHLGSSLDAFLGVPLEPALGDLGAFVAFEGLGCLLPDDEASCEASVSLRDVLFSLYALL